MSPGNGRKVRWFAISGLIVIFTALIGGTPVHADIYSQIQDKQDQLKQVNAKQDAVKGQLGVIADNIKANEAALQKSQNDWERAKANLASVNDMVTQTQAQLEKVQADLADVTAKLAHRQQLLGTRVRSLQEQGQVNYLDVLFGSYSLSDFIDRVTVLRLVVQEDATLFKDIRSTKAQVEDSQRRVADRKTQLLVLQQQREREKITVEHTIATIQATAAQLENDRKQYLSMLDDLEAANKRLEAEIAADQARANRHHIGKLVLDFPVRPVRITDPYGMRVHPLLHVWRMHWGTDFAADYGQYVYAPESGYVMQSGLNGNSAYGNTVTIDHGDGVATLAAHMSKVLVAEGETVKKGQVIGLAGATGWATGPHVHFEVRIGGKALNPMDYLPSL